MRLCLRRDVLLGNFGRLCMSMTCSLLLLGRLVGLAFYSQWVVADTCFMIASKGYKGIMKMIDTVGGFHLLNYFLKEEQKVFDQVKDLVKGEFDQAEVVCRDFPFED